MQFLGTPVHHRGSYEAQTHSLSATRRIPLHTGGSALDFLQNTPLDKLFLKIHFAIKEPVLGWIPSFLTCRNQWVLVEGHMSTCTCMFTPMTSGVPQGSILGRPLNSYLLLTSTNGMVLVRGETIFHEHLDL